MIAYIKGQLQRTGDNYLVVENLGIGYRVYVPESLIYNAKVGQTLELYTHHHLREEMDDLYGFAQSEELELFEKLISVSGVGPKTALNVFSMAKAGDIISAIASGDSTLLKKVSGIGGKTADKIVIELKNKIRTIVTSEPLKNSADWTESEDAVSALLSLGYSETEARAAMQTIPENITDLSEKIKLALKQLAK
jgi:Holliday junction DNA helicase RuvA